MKSDNPIKIANAHIVFDLHGVLISKNKMSEKYDFFIVKFLENHYNITLKDSINSIRKANNAWLKYWKKAKTLTRENLIPEYEKANSLWAEVIFQENFKGDYRQLAEFLEYFIPTQFCCLYSEVKEEILKLRSMGLTLSIASSAYTRHSFGTLVGCNLLSYFYKIIGLEKTKALKSDSNYYKETYKILQTKPTDVIFIGNSYDEISIPKKLGSKAIHINREIVDEQKVNSILYQADLILPDLKNLHKLLFDKKIIIK